MRTSLRVLVALVLFLGALAWTGAAIVNGTTRKWFEKDVSLRARLALNGAAETLGAGAASRDVERLSGILDEIVREERVMAAAVCSPEFHTLALTGELPERDACERAETLLAGGLREGEALDDAGGLVHVMARRLGPEGDAPAGYAVVVQDLSFLERREAAMRRFTAIAFGVVALLASILTVIVRRVSWRTWTEELRRVLSPAALAAPRKEFKPLLSDVRQLVSELAAEGGARGRWSAERLRKALTEQLHGDSVVLLANREPYLHDRRPDATVQVRHPASGLVTALEPVMRACSGTWVAHGSGSADRDVVDERQRVLVPPGEESYAIRRVWLTEEEERGYYYGFSNEGLWPLCHIADTRPNFRAVDFRHYDLVNRRFADAVCEEVDGPDPIVLVQDYHFALAPRMIRERLPHATVISFWHIPWPNAERFGICPWAKELLVGMLGSSVVGFHTQLHCNNFLEAVDRHLEARIDRERQAVVLGGRESLVRAYPISVDWPNRWAAGAPPVAECRREVFAELGLPRDAKLGVGVDRLDYTKGIEERLRAVARMLERFPHLVGKFTFAQLAAPSRSAIETYRALDERVERLAEEINARFARGRWRPIAFLRAHHEPPAIFRYLRAADVCYVSSLHDGMNLVAKEFVAARDDERGVLVLSRFTGAAKELTEALLVNPYDVEEASAALATALAMPADEQAARLRAMRSLVADRNVYRWAGRMLTDAARLRQRDRLSSRLSFGLRPVRDFPGETGA